MIKKGAAVLGLIIIAGVFVAWLNRGEVLLKIVKMSGNDVAPNQEIV